MAKPFPAAVVTLNAKLERWSLAYYDGHPEVDDATFDAERERLKQLWPEAPAVKAVGAPVRAATPLRKAKHGIPMGSLANAFDADGIIAFVNRVRKLSDDAGLGVVSVLVLEPKMDGLSVDLRYQNGRFVQAITRGDGVEGEDVTHTLQKAHGVPKNLGTFEDLWVRGETVIHRGELAIHFPDAANARNAAAGTTRRLDAKGAEHLRFYAFDAVNADGSPIAATQAKVNRSLETYGFVPPPFWLLKHEDGNMLATALVERWQAFKEERERMPYDCDGLVVKVGNIAKSRAMGEVDSCPRGMVAMKWRDTMTAETILRAVDHSVGRTGAITPVAILDPVAVGGVTVTRASLCNYDEVVRLGVSLGCRVRLTRAGEVVPKITAVLASSDTAPIIQRPARCPKCAAETVEDGPRQMCPTTECPGRTFRAVTHWVRQRVIMHLGDETIDRLMSLDGPVQSIDDLYHLTEQQMVSATGGVLMSEKVLASIEKSRDCPLHELLGSVGIPSLGFTEAKKLIKALNVKTVDEFVESCKTGLGADIPGFGEEKIRKVVDGCRLREDLLYRLDRVLRVSVAAQRTGPLSGRKVCATGASELPREKIIALITDAGGEWKSSVVNGLDYLIMADPNSGSTKAEAARKKGVKCISESEFLNMVGFAE